MLRARRHSTAMLRLLIIMGLIVLITTGTVVAWTRHYYRANLQPVNVNQGTKSLTIPTGYTLKQTSGLLKSQGLIRNAIVFEQYVRSVDASDKIKAGTYELSPSYSVQEIVSIITEGKVKTNLVTILPGQTLRGISQALTNAGYTQAEANAALDPALYSGHPALVDKPKTASLEGYLYPESFQKTNDTKAETIIRAALDEMQKRLTPEVRELFAKQGIGVYDAITLASIVEKEVPKSEDRKQVAQVFLRRLREGTRLESDATTNYKGLNGLTSAAYNTYENDGLPPSPIANVTESALAAIARPASTDWLYFVSGDDGITYFARTKAEHDANIAQHCQKNCSR